MFCCSCYNPDKTQCQREQDMFGTSTWVPPPVWMPHHLELFLTSLLLFYIRSFNKSITWCWKCVLKQKSHIFKKLGVICGSNLNIPSNIHAPSCIKFSHLLFKSWNLSDCSQGLDGQVSPGMWTQRERVLYSLVWHRQWMVASTFCFLTDDVEEEDFFFLKNSSSHIHRTGRLRENGVLRKRTQRISSLGVQRALLGLGLILWYHGVFGYHYACP